MRDDDLGARIDGGLRIIGLHEAILRLHDAAFRIGEVAVSYTHLDVYKRQFIMRREGDVYRAGAAVGFAHEYIEFLKNHPLTVDRGSITGRAVLERRSVQIMDVATDPEYTLRESTSLARQHTALGVPLLRENEPVSYTHLDVYKRQGSLPSMTNTGAASRWSTARARRRPACCRANRL